MTARLWLERHRAFRDMDRALAVATAGMRETPDDWDAFRRWLAPSLRHFLSQLHHHHHAVEDHHYFPAFRAAEPRLLGGFELLEADHDALHATIAGAAEAANGFLRRAPTDADGLKAAFERFAATGDALSALLMRHLDDEEDLVVPLMIARGEADLGIG